MRRCAGARDAKRAETPRGDPTLQAALNLLPSVSSFWDTVLEMPEARATGLVFGTLPHCGLARYIFADDAITVNFDLRGERLAALATPLAHELWRVAAGYFNQYPRTQEGRLQDEVDAAARRPDRFDTREAGPAFLRHYRVASGDGLGSRRM